MPGMSAPNTFSPEVEVYLKSEGIWVCGEIIDIHLKDNKPDHTSFAVRIEHHNADHDEEVTVAAAEIRAAGVVPRNFSPQVGEIVEVQTELETGRMVWSKATVTNIKGDFYYYRIDGSKSRKDEIAEWHRLRPPAQVGKAGDPLKGIDIKAYRRESVALDEAQGAWAHSEDGRGCLSTVQEKSGVLLCAPVTAGKKQSIVIFGSDKTVKKATLLIDVHMTHQQQIKKFQQNVATKVRDLEEVKHRYDQAYKAEFYIDENLVGNAIGKGGKNIQKVQLECNVEISISSDQASKKRHVRIIGNNKEDVDKAREQIEYVVDEFVCKPEDLGWIVGSKWETMKKMVDKAECLRADWDEMNECINITGLRSCVDNCLTMLEAHVEYRELYSQMDNEMKDLNNMIAEQGGVKGRNSGKGEGKKGKGKKSANDDDDMDEKPKGEGKKGKGKKQKRDTEGDDEKSGEKSESKGEGKSRKRSKKGGGSKNDEDASPKGSKSAGSPSANGSAKKKSGNKDMANNNETSKAHANGRGNGHAVEA